MNIQTDISLSSLSTFLIGGTADYYIEIFSRNDLKEAFTYIQENNLSYMYLGGGSNTLFSDRGYRGCILHFKNNQIAYDKISKVFHVESGARIMEVFSSSAKHHKDFSVFSTIPGTIGGAIAGNAGLPDGEIKDVAQEITLFDICAKEFLNVTPEFLDFSYRHTNFQDTDFYSKYCVWSCVLDLPDLDEKLIREKARTYLSVRKEKQPWGKTGGSFFKNDKKGAAGYFLDQAGLNKDGEEIGGAFFSKKHANFMMNDGTATQENIINLGKKAKQRVQDQFNVTLHHEIRILDEYGKLIEL